LSTYGLKAWKREMSTPLRCLVEYDELYLYLTSQIIISIPTQFVYKPDALPATEPRSSIH